MDYVLPNGDKLSLPDGATGADAAAAIGPGLAKAALAIKVDGVTLDLARQLPTGGEGRIEIITEKSGDEALELIRHDAAHVFAEAMLELYPGVQISIGPPIENGFYYDFDLPDGVTLNEDDFPAIEARMREHIAADEAFVREDVPVGGRARALPGRRPGLQGRADRGPREERSRRRARGQTVSLYTNGDVRRPLPRPARADHEADQGLQAAVGCRRLLARGLEQQDAHARLWDRVLLEQGPRGVPRAARARPRQRPSPARPAARDVRLLGDRAGFGVLVPARHRRVERAGQAQPRDGGPARLHRGQDAAALRQLAVEDLRPLGQVPRRHVHHRVRGPADGAQADELPRPLPAVSVAAALLPGSAGAVLGARPAASQRAERHAARPAARPPLRPGRRPHLLHRGPDPGRGRRRAAVRLRHLQAVRARREARALDPAGATGSAPTSSGTTASRRSRTRSTDTASSTRSTRATAPSTGRRSTCT